MTPDDFWRQYNAITRRAMCFQVADDLRNAAIQADDFGHEARERAFAKWAFAHPFTLGEVVDAIGTIGDRKEWWR
ncbi:hypothetical protein LF41_2395 [Lysobacter dokdonensis DS-58]|uniref:Uncharacterized protein n=1 Tax=Lysobacter dokdonensis DS-58 TaxID=1300345 RepID=A0A0A2WJ88_9GAMM|nr:hypothetical protein [Lysobacter dokdonensis]KGQ19888.1 hypothetical protein LF41_2395 [Lysobacter dokdonensis DS-58]